MKKSVVHDIFDQVFLINLERDKIKKIKTYNALKKKGIRPLIWKATDGYEKENLAGYQKYLDRKIGDTHDSRLSKMEHHRNLKIIESAGAWGVLKSYENIIEYSIEKEYERILILEDDIILDNSFEDKFQSFYQKVDKEWKAMLLGASQHDWTKVDVDKARVEGIYRPTYGDTLGAFALGLKNDVFHKFLNLIRYMDSPVDLGPLGGIFDRYSFNSYVAFPNIIMPDVTSSSIREPRDQVLHSEKMKWELNNFPFPQMKPIISIIFDFPDAINLIDIGQSRLEQLFHVNWLYFNGKTLMPVHSSNSPALKQKCEPRYDLTLLVTNLAYQNPSEYFIKLRPTYYKEDKLIEEITELVLNDITPSSIDIIIPNDSKEKQYTEDLVSIIIPTYLRPANLKKSIESVINQTYVDLEIIIVDDNDPGEVKEETAEVVNPYLKDNRVQFIAHDKNINGSAARNTGLMSSTGKYIGFLDDDDIYLPEKIELCVRQLKNSSSKIGGVYGGYLGWNSKEEDLSRYRKGNLTEDLFTLSFDKNYLHTNTALYKRSALLNINGFDDSFRRHQDLEINIRFFEQFEIDVVKQIVVKLRPEIPKNSNRVFGKEMYLLKKKFLLRFKDNIQNLPNSVQDLVYFNQWNEAKSCCKDDLEFYEICLEMDDIGILSFMALQENYSLIKSDILDQRNEKNIKLNHMNSELSELRSQNTWYANTYSHLPKWYVRLGSIFRRWPFGSKKWL